MQNQGFWVYILKTSLNVWGKYHMMRYITFVRLQAIIIVGFWPQFCKKLLWLCFVTNQCGLFLRILSLKFLRDIMLSFHLLQKIYLLWEGVNQKIYFIGILQCITTIGYNLILTLYICNNHYGHFAGNWKRKQSFLSRCKILLGLKIF